MKRIKIDKLMVRVYLLSEIVNFNMFHVFPIPDKAAQDHCVVCWQESEARTELLRQKSRHRHGDELDLPAASSHRRQHINFFEDLELGVSHICMTCCYWHFELCDCDP